MGGPSVFPYQPPGLWEELAFGGDFTSQSYTTSKGDDLYRRGLYTYWKRSLPNPSLTVFDAPNRELCTVQRPRTNTPLQALVLLNDPVYVEAARVLAQRTMREGGSTPPDRLAYAFRLCTARTPSDRELDVLLRHYHQQLDNYRKDPKAAAALIRVGESPRPDGLDDAELAAWTADRQHPPEPRRDHHEGLSHGLPRRAEPGHHAQAVPRPIDHRHRGHRPGVAPE